MFENIKRKIKGKLPQYRMEEKFYYSNLELVPGAIADPNGLGMLNLMLKNAHIPPQYYDIFYQMFYGMPINRLDNANKFAWGGGHK